MLKQVGSSLYVANGKKSNSFIGEWLCQNDSSISLKHNTNKTNLNATKSDGLQFKGYYCTVWYKTKEKLTINYETKQKTKQNK